jgi:glycerophosphoryl diester phosphodiesterase
MVPEDINKDGKVDDADKTALSPMNLITEVHKIGLQVHTLYFRNENHRLLRDYNNDPSRVPSFYKLELMQWIYRYSCKSKKEKLDKKE